MGYIFATLIGLFTGFYIARHKENNQGIESGDSFKKPNNEPVSITAQSIVTKQGGKPKYSKKKEQNRKKILDFVKENESIKNNNVEELLGVTDSTAERYLNELEKEGFLKQNGETGRSVYYTKK